MSTKFEQLLDLLVNEEMDKANELFHTIVVEKSREIYETMIAEEAEEEDDESSEDKEDESVEEGFADQEDESMYEIGGDAADDMLGDVEDPSASGEEDDSEDEFGGDEFGGDISGEEDGSAPATKDDVMDIKDSFEELSMMFQAMLNGEKHEEEGNPDVHGGALDNIDGEDDAFGDDEFAEPEASEADEQFMREYKEVVGKPYTGGKVAGKTEDSGTHKVSPISKASGRPTTSASAKNIAQSSTGADNKAGAGGLVGKVKGEFTGNHLNKVGGYKGDAFTKNAAGHGAEKKGSGEGSTNSKPIVDKQQ